MYQNTKISRLCESPRLDNIGKYDKVHRAVGTEKVLVFLLILRTRKNQIFDIGNLQNLKYRDKDHKPPPR
jgi:hypothetical protein